MMTSIINGIKRGGYFLFSLPKTIYFNLVSLPIAQAIRLPIFLGWNVRIIETHKDILHFPNGIKPFMVRIGYGGSPSLPSQKSSVRLRGGSLSFLGRARMSAGTIIHVNGHMAIGRDFSSNKNAFLSCTSEVIIGDNVLLGWDCHILDDNGGHVVLYDGMKSKSNGTIRIGNNVWLCSFSHLLAGAEISDGSVVAYRSLLNKRIEEKNVMVAGIPATVKRHNVEWNI